MSIAKPFTFIPGKPAESAKVNKDFDILYSQVNTNIADIAQNALDIQTIGDDKANINGDSTKRFAVANPTVGTDAVNKQTMEETLEDYALADLSNITGGVSSKLTSTDKANIVAYGMPNFATSSYIAITPSASGTYTAPNSGYISLIFRASGNDPVYKVYIDNKQIYQFSRGGDYGGGKYNTLFCTIDKGSVLKWDLTQCNTSSSIWHFIKSNNG